MDAWQAHEGELRGWLRHSLGDEVLAEDMLQDLFLKALRQGERFWEVRQPRSWLFATARHMCVDHHRLRKVVVPVPDAMTSIDEPVAPIDSMARCLPRALAELSQADADILRCCDIEGMTQAAYAEAHDLSLSGAKSRLQRARRRLEVHLTAACQVRLDETGRVCCFVPREPPG